MRTLYSAASLCSLILLASASLADTPTPTFTNPPPPSVIAKAKAIAAGTLAPEPQTFTVIPQVSVVPVTTETLLIPATKFNGEKSLTAVVSINDFNTLSGTKTVGSVTTALPVLPFIDVIANSDYIVRSSETEPFNLSDVVINQSPVKDAVTPQELSRIRLMITYKDHLIVNAHFNTVVLYNADDSVAAIYELANGVYTLLTPTIFPSVVPPLAAPIKLPATVVPPVQVVTPPASPMPETK
jgi:hypothetical protein